MTPCRSSYRVVSKVVIELQVQALRDKYQGVSLTDPCKSHPCKPLKVAPASQIYLVSRLFKSVSNSLYKKTSDS